MNKLPLLLLAIGIYWATPTVVFTFPFFQHPEKRLAEAQQQFDAGNYLTADATLQHIWTSNADPELEAKTLYLWGESDFRAGLYLDATDHFQRYLATNPQGDQADVVHCRLGWMAEQRHDFVAAGADYGHAFRLDNSDDARTGKLRVLLAQGRFDDAQNILNTLPEKLAVLYRPLLNARGALGFDPASTVTPHYQLAESALQANDTRTALREFRNAMELELQPELRDDARLQAGKLLLADHNSTEAVAVLSPDPETNIHAAEWLYWRAVALQSQKRVIAATKVFRQLIENYPHCSYIADAYLHLSVIYSQQGDAQQAGQDRQAAIDHGADRLASLPEMIRLQIVMGDTTTARSLWNTLPDSSRFDRTYLNGLLQWGTPASVLAFQRAKRFVGSRHTPLLAYTQGAQVLQQNDVASQKAGLQEAVRIAALANNPDAMFFLGTEYTRRFPYVTRLTLQEMDMESLLAGFEIQTGRYSSAIHRYERIIAGYPDEEHRKVISASIRNLLEIVPDYPLPDSLRDYRPHGTGYEQTLQKARTAADNGHWTDALAGLHKMPSSFPGVSTLTLQCLAHSGSQDFPRNLSQQLKVLTGHDLETAALSGLDYALVTRTHPSRECLQVLDGSGNPSVVYEYQLHLSLLAEQQGDIATARSAINRAYLASATHPEAFREALTRIYHVDKRRVPVIDDRK